MMASNSINMLQLPTQTKYFPEEISFFPLVELTGTLPYLKFIEISLQPTSDFARDPNDSHTLNSPVCKIY